MLHGMFYSHHVSFHVLLGSYFSFTQFSIFGYDQYDIDPCDEYSHDPDLNTVPVRTVTAYDPDLSFFFHMGNGVLNNG